MNNQIKPSVTNPTIADIYQSISEEQLILRPDFQRKFVWTHEHQENFIDTILHGLPFPEIYVCAGDVNVKKLRTTRHVIDGQQRLTTIRNYIDGTLNQSTKVPSFNSLNDVDKQQVLSYQVVVRDIGKVDEGTVREIFRRINITKFKLDDIEIHNAIYDGRFIRTAKAVLDTIDLSKYGVLRESEFTRMADLHFILLVMATLENGGYFAQDKEVETKVSNFNEVYPNEKSMYAVLDKTFKIISKLDLPEDSMWFRKGNFFTLVVEIAFHAEEIPENLKNNLIKFENLVIKNKAKVDSLFGKYYHHMYQATHGRTSRVVRSNYFRKYCLQSPG